MKIVLDAAATQRGFHFSEIPKVVVFVGVKGREKN